MIYNFQALRAVAALLVTFVHLEIFASMIGIDQSTLSFGHFGVDLFFVLSGFVIVHSTAKSEPTAREFMVSRIIRVVPIYWLFTLCVFAIALSFPQALNATTADWSNLLKSLLFIPYVKENGLIQPILFVGWTLNYEMYFYTLFAIFLLIMRRRLRPTVICTTVFICGFSLAVNLVPPDSVILRFFGYPIVLEFAMGMWIALWAQTWSQTTSKFACPVLILASAWLLLHSQFVPDAPRWIVAGIPSAAILWAALILERSGHALTNKTVQLLGAASYALYLSHPFVLQAIGKAIEPFGHPIAGWIFGALALIFAHIVGVFLHLKVEKPLVRFFKAFTSKQSGPPYSNPLSSDTSSQQGGPQ